MSLFGGWTSLLLEVVFLLFVIALIVRYVIVPRIRWASVDRLPGPKAHWFWGNLYENIVLKKDGVYALQFDQELMLEHKHLYRRWVFFIYPWVSICSGEAAKVILQTATPKGHAYDRLKDWLGEGLLTSAGDRWKNHRRLLTPAFHFNVLKGFVPIYQRHAFIMLEQLKNLKGSTDVQALIHNLTLDIIGECAFGYPINSQKKRSDYAQAIFDCTELVVKRIFNPVLRNDRLYSLTANGRRWQEALITVHTLPETVIRQRYEERTRPDAPPRETQDFLDILLEAYGDGPNDLSFKDVRDEVDTFMFEGHDTTGSGLTWMLYNIATHPEVEERVVEEVDRVLGDRLAPEFEDLKKFEYLARVIKESLRLYPPVPYISRLTTEEIDLDIYGEKVHLPKNLNLSINVHSIHRNPLDWENPDEFDPERFSKERIDKRHSFAFVPFSAGPRNCIGQKFAMNEEVTLLAMIYRQYTVRVEPGQKIEATFSAVLRPKNGINVTFHPRR